MTVPSQQLALPDQLFACDICHGTGQEVDRETRIMFKCRCCQGLGYLEYDPATLDGNPFRGLSEQT